MFKSKARKVNRGIVAFIVILAVLVVMLTCEIISVNSAKNEIFNAIEAFAGEEAKYYVLPEELRDNDFSDAQSQKILEDARIEFKEYFYSNAATGIDYLVDNKISDIKSFWELQAMSDEFCGYIKTKVDRDNSAILLSGNGKEAKASISLKIYYAEDAKPYVSQCKYTLVKENGKWYFLNADSITQ